MMSKRGRKPGQGAGHHELRVETQLGCGLGLGQEAEGSGRGGVPTTRHFYTCHHALFILTTSLRMKVSCLFFANGCPRVKVKACELA